MRFAFTFPHPRGELPVGPVLRERRGAFSCCSCRMGPAHGFPVVLRIPGCCWTACGSRPTRRTVDFEGFEAGRYHRLEIEVSTLALDPLGEGSSPSAWIKQGTQGAHVRASSCDSPACCPWLARERSGPLLRGAGSASESFSPLGRHASEPRSGPCPRWASNEPSMGDGIGTPSGTGRCDCPFGRMGLRISLSRARNGEPLPVERRVGLRRGCARGLAPESRSLHRTQVALSDGSIRCQSRTAPQPARTSPHVSLGHPAGDTLKVLHITFTLPQEMLGPMYLSRAVKDAGSRHEVPDPPRRELALTKVKEYAPDVVTWSTMTGTHRQIFNVNRVLKGQVRLLLAGRRARM